MMTMPLWLARPLRRFAGTAAMMVLGGQAFVYGRLHPGPEMPPRDADRVVATAHDGAQVQITDPHAVRRITDFVRDRRDPVYRSVGDRLCFVNLRTLCFHRGAGGALSCVQFDGQSMNIRAGSDVLIYKLTPAEAARLERLLAEHHH